MVKKVNDLNSQIVSFCTMNNLEMIKNYKIDQTNLNTVTWLGILLDERLRHRSCDQKVPSSIPRSGISVEVTSQC